MTKFYEWLWQEVSKRFRLRGLILLVFITGVVFIWWNWRYIVFLPGVSNVLTYISSENVPLADSKRLSIAVVNLNGDNERNEYKQLITRLLRDVEGIQVVNIDKTVSIAGPILEETEYIGHRSAREYLSECDCSVLIWGSILRYGNHARHDLYFTSAGNTLGKSRQYLIDIGSEFKFPDVLWEDLSKILVLAITEQQMRVTQSYKYQLPFLKRYIEQITNLQKDLLNKWFYPDTPDTQLRAV